MASIESLLNPVPDQGQYSLPSPTLTTSTGTVTTSRLSRQKRQKVAKDAPIFTKDKIRGKMRYPPCEERDEELTKRHREFQIFPMGNIADYPRHIPYNSDKKTFQEKTGRESFEVFQYTFKVPGEDKQWLVMWDYNIGLVRTTHLFKCQNYSKTTPAKMLDANPGLREICHSITGGAIAAQGYWMPFEAAKAVAATFCWRIRYALTPIFGLDFPSQCIHSQDRTRRFGQMIIDPAVVRKATETAIFYRHSELRSAPLPPALHLPAEYSRPSSRDSYGGGPRRPIIPRVYHRPHTHRYGPHHRHNTSYPDSLVEYSSSPEFSTASTSTSASVSATDSYCVSPSSPFRNTFTPVNTPRSCDTVSSRVASPYPTTLPLSLRRDLAASTLTANTPSDGEEEREEVREEEEDNLSNSSTLYSENSSTDCLSELDDDDEEYHNSSDSDIDVNMDLDTDTDMATDTNTNTTRKPASPCATRKTRTRRSNGTIKKTLATRVIRSRQKPTQTALFACEVKAAHALLSLHMQDATGSDEEVHDGMLRNERKRRRASA